MSISSENSRIQYTITSLGQTLSVPWYFLEAADLKAVRTRSNVDTDLVLNTDYTVANAGNPAGGSITLTNAAAAVGDVVTIYRNDALTQPATYPSTGQFPSATNEQGLDRLTMLIQQMKLDVERSLRIPVSNSSVSQLTKASRSGKLLGFNDDGSVDLSRSADNIVDEAVAAMQAASTPPFIAVEAYGAVGDGSTDDAAAIKRCCDAVQSLGGGIITFKPNKTYKVTASAGLETQGRLGNFNAIPIRLDFNGCTINVTTAYSGSEEASLFTFTSCSAVSIGAVKITAQEEAIAETRSRGVASFVFFGTCRNVFAEPISQTGGRICVYVRRVANTDAVSHRTIGAEFQLLTCTKVGYPLALSHSGDMVKARIVADKCGRDAIVYGVRNVELDVISSNHYSQLLIQAYNNTAPAAEGWSDDPLTQNVRLNYLVNPASVSRSSGGGPGSLVALAAQGPGACTLRDIRINIVSVENGSYPEGAYVQTFKLNNGSVDTTAGRGHSFEDIKLSCNLANIPGGTMFDLWDGTSTGCVWTGEVVRGFEFEDVIISSGSTPAIAVGLGALYRPVFRNIASPGALTLNGSVGGGTWVTLENIATSNFTVPLLASLPSYTVSGVPSAAAYPRAMIYVSNESGGEVPAFSDGTNWRRVTDRNIVS